MITYPELQIPQAWRPIFQALEAQDWELHSKVDLPEDSAFSLILRFVHAFFPDRQCYLSFWNEAEWCGNNLQSNALRVIGLGRSLPSKPSESEENSIVLTGDWEFQLTDWIQNLGATIDLTSNK
jgi:hypothetical protein